MKAEDLIKWYREEMIPNLVKNGYFSETEEEETFESCEFESPENYKNNFASLPCFAKLKLKTSSGTKLQDIIIKFQHLNPVFRQKMRTEPQYRNEKNFFNLVLPCFTEFLKFCGHKPEFIAEILPKCYFASDGNGHPEKAVVILNDLRNSGFRLCDSPTDLDRQHCLLAIERLARFHSLSFALKLKKWEPFEKMKTLFENVVVAEDPTCREQCEDYNAYVCQRGIDYLLKQDNSEIPKEYLENLRGRLKSIFEFFKTVHEPLEPLSVICHGDFNRNNILFRYGNGEVLDAKLIDFQRVIYGSPTLDFGFLVYMNTTLEFRQKHFDELFQFYYSNLVRNVSSITGVSYKAIADWIPFKAFEEDFERTALYHYVVVSFFLPVMMSPDDEFETDITIKTFKQMGEKNYKQGGEAASQRLADILIDFYRRKFYL